MSLGRKEVLLGVLLLVLVFTVGKRLLQSAGVVGGARGVAATTADAGEARTLIAGLPALSFSAADDEDDAPYKPKRNIFEYITCPVDAERERAQRARLEAMRKADADRDRKKQELAKGEAIQRRKDKLEHEKVNPPRPVAPRPDFEYAAYMGQLNDLGHPAIAVFEKGRGRDVEILIGRVGEVVDEDFVVKLIDWDRVELGYADPKFSNEQPRKLDRKDL